MICDCLLIKIFFFKTLIKRTLSEINCPSHVINELMENCHERKWPPGLSSLETRQNSRRLYENYICKRIPGKQAVLVLQCDNTHMPEDMIKEPGLVMIFAHGIEWRKKIWYFNRAKKSNFHFFFLKRHLDLKFYSNFFIRTYTNFKLYQVFYT